MPIGWFGEDAVDWVGDRVSDAADVFSQVGAQVPFAPELAGALKSVINGPLRDVARSPYGLVVLRAMATTIYGPLAWTIGPQLASFAFAFPGIVRGDDFWHAWLTEVQWRAEKTAEIIAPTAAEQVTPQIKHAADQLSQMLPEEVRAMALDELAARLHVDEWTVAMAEAFLGLIPIPNRGSYDPVSGKHILRAVGRSIAYDAARVAAVNPCDAMVRASQDGQPAAIIDALEHKCLLQNIRASAGATSTTADGDNVALYDLDPHEAAAVVVAAATPDSPTKKRNDIVLGVTIAAAVVALVLGRKHFF